MKKILALLFIAFLFFNKTFSQSSFQIAFGDSLNEYVKCVTPLDRGGYVMCGNVDGGLTHEDAFLARIDLSGNLLWFKTYATNHDDVCFNVIETVDQGFAFTGTIENGPFGNDDIFVAKTDSDGTMQWDSVYGTTDVDQAYDIRQTPAGDFLIAGFTTTVVGSNYDGYVLKISASGTLKWSQIFGGMYNEGVYTIEFAANGNYVFAGKSEMYANGQADYLLLETDTSGNIQWIKNYGGAGYEVALQVRRTSDNGFILDGFSDSYTSSGIYDVLAVKTDSVGNLLWVKNYHKGGIQYSDGVLPASDGGFYFSGSSSTTGVYDVILFKTDSDGNVDWAKAYQHGSSVASYPFNIHESSLHLICFGGYLFSGTDDDALVVVSDEEGNTGDDCSTSFNFTVTAPTDLIVSTPSPAVTSDGASSAANLTVNTYLPPSSVLCIATETNEVSDSFAIHVSPVPASDVLNIEIKTPAPVTGIVLLNAQGKILRELKNESGLDHHITIDISALENGIYFLEFSGLNGWVNCKKIIKSN